MLVIKDLHASIEGKEILKGVNLTVRPGEVHAIMEFAVEAQKLLSISLEGGVG